MISVLRRPALWAPLSSAAVVLLVAGCVGATDATVLGATRRTTTTPTTTEAPLPACVDALTREQKAGQLLMVLVSNPAAAGPAVAAGKVAGYALVGSQSGDVAGEISAVRAGSALPVIASGDEEGGTVQRFRDLLGPLPSAADLAQNSTPENAGRTFQDYGTKLAELGLTMNLGPSLDVGGGSGLGTRSFGTSVETVAEYGLAVLAGVRAAGLVPVAKHWPGIGGGQADPHTAESPVAELATLRSRDLVPFDRAIAAGVEAIMVSHAIVPGLTKGLPASLSRPAITDELRGRQGFGGLVITDSLGMGAVTTRFDDASASVIALGAGADLALLSGPDAVDGAYTAVLDAIGDGRLPQAQVDRSVGRVLRAKGVTGACPG